MRLKMLAAALALGAAGTAHSAVTEFVIYKQENFRGPSQTVKGEVANLEGGFAREGSSLIVRGGNWEVCTRDHFKGDCHVIGPGEYPSLGPELRDRIVAVRFVGDRKSATFDDRRGGRDRRDDRADRDHDRRDRREHRGARNEWGGTLDLYNGQDFRGRSVRVERNERDLANLGFADRASSVVVHEGTWELCSEPNFGGRCQVFRPGEYRYLAGLDDRVASARRAR